MADIIPSPEEPRKPQFTAPRGTHDFLPEDHLYFTYLKKAIRHRARQSGLKRISTPVFEEAAVFARSIGADTDIVEKEMYTFTDSKGTLFALRPELTAGIMRSYIEHGMSSLPQPVEFYAIESCFRHDKPQKGRYRQFHQYDFEVMGESDPALDVQMIQLVDQINHDIGIADRLTLQINTIGDKACRPKFKAALVDYYTGKERSLCDACKSRLQKNPLRLLDCKEEDCRLLAVHAPRMKDYLCEECRTFHASVLEYLDALGIAYVQNPSLVRGLDYYTRTVFEWWDASEGAQNAIGGGGRYDGLAELLGSSVPVPAVGLAVGVERTIAHMKAANIQIPSKDDVHVFFAQLGPEAKKRAIVLLPQLREAGIKTVGALGKASMKAQLRLADKFKAPWCVILGGREVLDGTVILRDMQSSKQVVFPIDKLIPEIVKRIGKQNLDIHSPDESAE